MWTLWRVFNGDKKMTSSHHVWRHVLPSLSGLPRLNDQVSLRLTTRFCFMEPSRCVFLPWSCSTTPLWRSFPPAGSILGGEKVFTLPLPFCQAALSYTSSLAGFPETAQTPGDTFLLAQTLLKAEAAVQQHSEHAGAGQLSETSSL